MSRWILLLCVISLSSCANQGLMKSGAEAEYNSYYIAKLRIGMTEDEVWDMMGRPYKMAKRTVRGEVFHIWYYITKGRTLGQTKMLARNMTPLVFQDQILKGWGRRYYNYLLDIDNARELYESREKQKYTDDRDEWPSSEHGYVPSPYEKEQARKKAAGELKDEEKKIEESTPSKPASKKDSKDSNERVNKYSIWDKKKKDSSKINKQQ